MTHRESSSAIAYSHSIDFCSPGGWSASGLKSGQSSRQLESAPADWCWKSAVHGACRIWCVPSTRPSTSDSPNTWPTPSDPNQSQQASRANADKALVHKVSLDTKPHENLKKLFAATGVIYKGGLDIVCDWDGLF